MTNTSTEFGVLAAVILSSSFLSIMLEWMCKRWITDDGAIIVLMGVLFLIATVILYIVLAQLVKERRRDTRQGR